MANNDLASIYQKKTDIQHILDAPDTYIGQVDEDNIKNWILKDNKMEYINYNIVPGLYKCFDEGIVNARDHWLRLLMKKKNREKNIQLLKYIHINVNKEDGVISMKNGGNGIDIVKHPEYNIWIPEMIFGHLRTSTNYNKNEKKLVGGKNGFGFKLVLIYSEWGYIETVDHVRKLKYTQKFGESLSKIHEPIITKYTGEPYTLVKWKPLYNRFGMDNLTDDMYNLFKKRTYDICAVTDKTVGVYFNDKKILTQTFVDYINLYIGHEDKGYKRIYVKHSDRWEYCICMSPKDEFTQVSFVNGVYTSKGGKHVDYLVNMMTKKMIAYILKKKKVEVKQISIKEQIMIFVNCVIENPSFDSQTKDYMNTPISKFGSKCDISDKDIDKLAKMGIMDNALAINELKEKKIAKKNEICRGSILRGVPKLMDAGYAGTKRSGECTLILCEGDSAKAGIVSGLSKEDRKYIGVFPLRGKLRNVHGLTIKNISNNVEINNIKKILGLSIGKKYTSLDELLSKTRYGKVCFMTDQDLDGSHIKGLCVNLFNVQWPELIKFDNVLCFMNTPIIKAKRGQNEICFYNDREYDIWKNDNNNGNGWSIKYYKGLGTSTSKEFKEYFKNKKMIYFKYNNASCSSSLDKVFNKSRADDRKLWLSNYNKECVLDTNNESISYKDFIDKEFIHFSKYDCERSIPNLIDGFKTSTRKILYGCFKRKLTKEVKVAQLSGYISEHSGYHHGEASLNNAIIGMAQEYLGSNNISMLIPNGQFGTRLSGGKDHASERYIYTYLNNITRYIFPEYDDKIYNYINDDGYMVEPEYYLPIIPMILVNGGKGIGTGFSYEGLQYNVIKIIDYLINKINKSNKVIDITPYYEGYKGTINKLSDTKFIFRGKYKCIGYNKISVTELPIGMWTDTFKELLESLMDKSKDKNGNKKVPIIKKYIDSCTDTLIDFTIVFNGNNLTNLISKKYDNGITGLDKTLKLYTTKSTTNMYLFNHKQQLKKYKTIYDIIDAYYPVRLNGYKLRKEYLIKEYERIVIKLTNKAKFIKEQCDNIIDLRRKKKAVIINLLKSRNYDIIDNDEEYKYLTKMPIDSVIEENINKLLKEKDDNMKHLNDIKVKTLENMWLDELNILKNKYSIYLEEREERATGIKNRKKKKKNRR